MPPDAAHLSERFGLFTLILLGESVGAVMQGMESQHDWSPAAAISAFVGMGISFLIWSWYFDRDAGAAQPPVHTRWDGVRLHIWSYAHVPLYVGIIITGVGVQRLVTAAAHTAVSATESTIFVGAIATVMLAMTTIGITSAARGSRQWAGPVRSVALAAVTLTVGIAGHVQMPVALLGMMAAFCLAQVGVSAHPEISARRT